MTAMQTFVTPEDVENAFYKAVNHGNLSDLLSVWAEEEELLCLHPNGTLLNSLENIRESWREILGGQTKIRLNFRRIGYWRGSMIAVHHLLEEMQSDSDDVSGIFRVTHVFMRGAYGWRMVCRHSSPVGNDFVMRQGAAGRRTLH
ncbi:MAG: nuclear transport factor 2 family protein [Betaproteobacteria bacterium]|nr:nuclear transport factor 2 family protein [Betaproteobacteria bacterium]